MKKLIIPILMIAMFSGCQNARETRTIRLAHTLDLSHPVHKAIVRFSELLEQKSGGKLKAEIYPNGQLGSERECLELMQIGSLDVTKVSASTMENFSPDYRVLGLPYIFRDSAHINKVLGGEIGRRLLTQGERYWLRGLCFYDAGSRSFYSKEKPIETPSDLKGLKVRVMNSKTAFDMIQAMGGSPTPVSWGELYTALQQGVVDAAENNAPSFYTSKHYEICKYYSIDKHTSVPDVLLVSTHLWNDLSDEEKEWVQAAADESVPYQKEVWAQAVEESLEAVKEAGVEIVYPATAPFQGAVENIYGQYKTSEPDFYNLIKEVQAVK